MPVLHRELSAKNVVIDLLRMTRERSVPVKSILEVCELFGLSPNSVRVAMTRLVASGMLESDERGCYRLSEQTDEMSDFIESWRQGDRRVIPWDDSWMMVHLPANPNRAQRNRSVKSLGYLGFKEGLERVWLRPNNLSMPYGNVCSLLKSIGLERDACIFVGSHVETSLESRWGATLWPIDELEKSYADYLDRLQKSSEKIEKMPLRNALQETFILGGEVVHVLVKDPMLPSEMMNVHLRQQLCEAMQLYDLQARKLWVQQLQNMPITMKQPEFVVISNAQAE